MLHLTIGSIGFITRRRTDVESAQRTAEGLRIVLEELRDRLRELYGERLVQMILYGSQAREDAEPESDVDVLVVLRGAVAPGEEISRTSETVADISLRHNAVVSCVFMDEDSFVRRNGPFLRNVRREGVPI